MRRGDNIEYGIAPASMVEVIAPSTLPGGYTFEAKVNDQTFLATVPPDGVEKGQRFETEFPARAPTTIAPLASSIYAAPAGRWKDGLCDCCRFGCCHPSLCLSLWCRAMALGQVLKRLHLTWYGREATANARTRNPFKIMTIITILYLVLDTVLDAALRPTINYTEDKQATTTYNDDQVVIHNGSPLLTWLISLNHLAFSIFTLIVIMRTRSYIRHKYSIPEGSRCKGCEDCCCAFWCSCCTVSQMSRHTADYDRYSASCCSDTGLPPNVSNIEAVAVNRATPVQVEIV